MADSDMADSEEKRKLPSTFDPLNEEVVKIRRYLGESLMIKRHLPKDAPAADTEQCKESLEYAKEKDKPLYDLHVDHIRRTYPVYKNGDIFDTRMATQEEAKGLLDSQFLVNCTIDLKQERER